MSRIGLRARPHVRLRTGRPVSQYAGSEGLRRIGRCRASYTGMGDRITYVGLDVHKDGVVVAVAEGGIRGEVREYGRIANTAASLDRLVRDQGQ
jgi:hypothetical protein